MIRINIEKICESEDDLQFKQIFNATQECYLS